MENKCFFCSDTNLSVGHLQVFIGDKTYPICDKCDETMLSMSEEEYAED